MGLFKGSKKFTRQSQDDELRRFVIKVNGKNVVVYAINKQEAERQANS